MRVLKKRDPAYLAKYNVKSLTALPESRVLDCIAQIFSDKIKADKVDRQKGHELDTLAQ